VLDTVSGLIGPGIVDEVIAHVSNREAEAPSKAQPAKPSSKNLNLRVAHPSRFWMGGDLGVTNSTAF
jgi:hypothetical protein